MRLHRYWSSSCGGETRDRSDDIWLPGFRDAGAVGRRRRLIVTEIFVCFSPLNNRSIGHAVRWRWTTNLGRILQFVASLYDKLNAGPLVIASTTLIGPVDLGHRCLLYNHWTTRNNLLLCGFYAASSSYST